MGLDCSAKTVAVRALHGRSPAVQPCAGAQHCRDLCAGGLHIMGLGGSAQAVAGKPACSPMQCTGCVLGCAKHSRFLCAGQGGFVSWAWVAGPKPKCSCMQGPAEPHGCVLSTAAARLVGGRHLMRMGMGLGGSARRGAVTLHAPPVMPRLWFKGLGSGGFQGEP